MYQGKKIIPIVMYSFDDRTDTSSSTPLEYDLFNKLYSHPSATDPDSFDSYFQNNNIKYPSKLNYGMSFWTAVKEE